MDKSFTSYHIEERSYVAYIKREIHSKVSRAAFSEQRAGEIDIIVSELSSNLIKHVGSGELLYRIENITDTDSVFEIISIDRGPGIADTARMLKDGVSTTSTLGHGLGAINRLSTIAQFYSIPGWGTIVYSMVRTDDEAKRTKTKTIDLDVHALCINKPRETVCGDGYRVKKTGSDTIIFFGDGLGHGERAKEAVDCAGDFFFENQDTDPVVILKEMHEKVRKTRGLVATIAVCDLKNNQWKICGVGNILTRMYTGVQYKNYMSYNGTVGLNLPNSMNASVFDVERNQHLIMCSDGIQTRWDLSRFTGIFKYDTTVLAAAIFKDFTRGNDDSSVLVAKVN
jgi:anti-sigma regulatory factor (Ser/Thr protein kinase)